MPFFQNHSPTGKTHLKGRLNEAQERRLFFKKFKPFSRLKISSYIVVLKAVARMMVRNFKTFSLLWCPSIQIFFVNDSWFSLTDDPVKTSWNKYADQARERHSFGSGYGIWLGFHILRPLLTTHKSANSSVLASVGGCAFADLFKIPPKRSKTALCLSIFVMLTPSVRISTCYQVRFWKWYQEGKNVISTSLRKHYIVMLRRPRVY